jgi:proline dehydrogenase
VYPVNKLMVSALRRLPKSMVKPVAMRYIAGEKLEEAIRVVRRLNARKMTATVDVLGENVSTEEESLRAVQACGRVLDAIQEERLEANLSVKLTQFGLKIDERFCYGNIKRILEIARGYHNFVRIDMEDSSLATRTLDLYERLRGEGLENAGVVIQAYLRRSEEDVKKLIRTRANVRLVKGIYVEPESIAFRDREEIRMNYLRLLKLLLGAGAYVGIATHDELLIEGAYRNIRELSLPPTGYEFQMLYGVRERLRDRVVADGHRMRIYVPFGEQWHSYSFRRFQENPRIACYILKAMLIKN